MTLEGHSTSTLGSFEARWNSASTAIIRPGAIRPPRYSPFSDTQSKVVAVPKSMTTQAEPKRW